MDKEKIVVIGAGEFQLPLVQKAVSMGYEVHCFAWEAGAVAKDEADFFYPLSITDKEAILEVCKDIKPVAVLTAGSDLAMPTVAYICEALSLCCNSFEVAKRCTDKYEMRKTLSDKGVAVPYFQLVGESDEIDADSVAYPVIVKPTDRSGSRGITLVDSPKNLHSAIKEAISHSFAKKAIIEGYISGDEYSCECISFEGEHHFLAFTKKFTTGAPNYIETGHIQPDDIPEKFKDKIISTILDALTALGITYGASHTEFRVDKNGNFGIIEIGARMGGDCIGSDLVQLSTGKDFLRMLIDSACGKKPNISPTCKIHNSARIDFIFTEDDLLKLESIKSHSPESIVRISNLETENIGHITDSSNRVGYYITVS